METYEYAMGDRIATPNSYSYAPFHGRAFLEAWKRSRAPFVAAAESATPPQVTPLASESLEGLIALPSVETSSLMDQVHARLERAEAQGDASLRRVVDLLVKKFEVTKRWAVSYGPGLRGNEKRDSATSEPLALYVRAAEVFEAAYRRYSGLPYLNALLKSLDALCSVGERLPTEWRSRVGWLARQERHHVVSLARVLEVPL